MKKSMMSLRRLLAASVVVVPILGAVNAAKAASISSGNSTLIFNTSDGSLPLVTNWIVDGVDQFGGSPAGGESPQINSNTGEHGIQALPQGLVSSSFSNGVASMTFQAGIELVNVKDVLTGGSAGSGASAINETITFTNTDTDVSQISLQFRDHVDYNVNGTAGDDTLTLSPGTPNTAEQTDPSGAAINFTATPTPDSFDLVNGGSSSVTLGPSTGNVAFDFNYNLLVPADGSVQLSFNEVLTGGTVAAVPLPSSAYNTLFTLAGLGAIGMFRRMRRAI